MWCPGVAALLTCKYLGRDVSSLGWRWGKSRYQAVCYLIPLAYGAATYAFVWLTGFGGFYNSQFVKRFSRPDGDIFLETTRRSEACHAGRDVFGVEREVHREWSATDAMVGETSPFHLLTDIVGES